MTAARGWIAAAVLTAAGAAAVADDRSCLPGERIEDFLARADAAERISHLGSVSVTDRVDGLTDPRMAWDRFADRYGGLPRLAGGDGAVVTLGRSEDGRAATVRIARRGAGGDSRHYHFQKAGPCWRLASFARDPAEP